MTASNSEIRVLIAAIRKNGYKVARTGNGSHQKVLRTNGSQVADENGPLIISGSPSDHRWRDMHVNRLMKAGVLKEDPWDPKKTGKDDDGKTQKERDEDVVKERKARDLRDRSEVFRVRTVDVRAAVEPIISKLGGWSRGGSGVKVADFAAVLRFWAERNDPKVIPLTTSLAPFQTSAWVTQVTNLRTAGGTISEKWLPLFEAFVVALREGNENADPTESSLVYMDLVRDEKGILSHPVGAGDGEPREIPEPVAARVVVEYPRVALEALFWMSRGADGQDRDEILDLAEEIAELAATNEERKNG